MRRFCLFLLVASASLPVRAQNGCPALQAPKPDPNILLTPSQETEFGRIRAEQLASNYQVIEDPALTGYLSRVGNRVAKQLPETGLHYEFLLYDRPEVQAFGIPGGRVYVSRKMVAFLKNEDELAGLLGHELGHMVAREQASAYSRMFREVLGLTSIPENDSLFDRYNQLLEATQLKRIKFDLSQEERGQTIADQLGLQGATRAGYSPQAFPYFLDRIMQTKGNTGSWFSDVFGAPNPNTKRLRELLKDLSGLPAACVIRDAEQSEQEFRKWQSDVLHYRGIGHVEKVPGVILHKTLADPLRGDITSFRFSSDGKYLLAQDDGGIYVLTRDPLKFLFRIDAPDAAAAQFSSDSQSVVFFSSQLRVETWDIARQVQTNVSDVPAIRGCRQTALSPNAKYLACFQYDFKLVVFEVSTGEKLLERERFCVWLPSFYPHSFNRPGSYYGTLFWVIPKRIDLVTMRFSPDEHYFAASSRTGEDAALDLTTKEKIKVSGKLHEAIKHSFTFIKPDLIVGIDEHNPQKSPVAEFPSGNSVDYVPLGETTLFPSGNPKYVLARPVIDHPVGVYDLEKKRVVFSDRNPAIDIWGEEIVSERLNGEIGIYKAGDVKLTRSAQLPIGSLGGLRTAVASPDLEWMAISTKTRGGVWDVPQGQRALSVRGFQNASYTAGPAFFFDFPEFEKLPRDFAIMSPVTKQSRERQIDKDDDLRFFGDTLLQLKTNKNDDPSPSRPGEVDAMDVARMTPLWSHSFPKGTPWFGGSAETGKIVFAWKAKAPGLHEEMLRDTKLLALWPKEGANDSDYFFQIVEARSGKNSGSVFLPTGKYSFIPEYLNAAGDWLVVTDNQHRVLLYSAVTGEAREKWFGDHPRLSNSGQLLAFENGSGHLLVYDLRTMRRANESFFSAPILAKSFSEDGKRLLVLLSNQTTFLLDVGEASDAERVR